MKMTTITVRAVPHARVPDIRALESNLRRFVGWKWSDKHKDWVLAGNVTVSICREYSNAIKSGDLELVQS